MLTFREVKDVLLEEVSGEEPGLATTRILSGRWDANTPTPRASGTYEASFKEIAKRGEFHEFEAFLGSLQCIVRINCPIECLEFVFIFFHGLGASPVNCLHLANRYFKLHGQERNCAFIFPRAPLKMNTREFGADGLSIYGSYKWWNILDFSEEKENHSKKETKSESTRPPTHGPGLFGWCKPEKLDVPVPDEKPSCGGSEFVCSPRRPPDDVKKDEPIISSLSPVVIAKHKRVTFAKDPEHSTKSHNSTLNDLPKDVPVERAQGVAAIDKKSAERSLSVNPHTVEKNGDATESGKLKWIRNIVEKFIDDCEEGFGLDRSRFVLAGFSQGGMVALDAMFNSPEPLMAVGIFSALPMCSEEWREKLKQQSPGSIRSLQKTLLFHSHGTTDLVAPYVAGVWLRRFLQRMGFRNHHFRHFSGKHVLDDKSFDEFLDMVSRQVKELDHSPMSHKSVCSRGSPLNLPVVRCAMFDDCTYKHTSALAKRCLPRMARCYMNHD